MNENKIMEKYLSKLLKQIKICDNLLGSSYDEMYASFYNKMLNMLLTNLTSHLNSDKDSLKELNDFAHLQLTIQKYYFLKIKIFYKQKYILNHKVRIAFTLILTVNL